MPGPRLVLAAAALGAALLAPVRAAGADGEDAGPRRMWFSSLESVARLDAAGDLHVREREAIVFDGRWNGAWRRFRLGPGQGFAFERLSRELPGGRLHELRPGSLDEVDRWQLDEATSVRWRSRLRSDPPFARETIVYVLEYTLTHVLSRDREGRIVLQHDFSFADREWPILAARGTVELDPAWRADRQGPLTSAAARLAPGDRLVVATGLSWVGPGREPHVAGPLRVPRVPPAVIAAGALVAVALAAAALLRHARARGQLSRGPRRGEVDAAFVQQHVLCHPPEVVGAAWDDTVGPPEVAAVLARMASEGKLSAKVERKGWWIFGRDVLHLELHAEVLALPTLERELVYGMFVEGTTIDTDRLRDHYRKTGFDPSNRLREPLERSAAGLAAGPEPAPARPLLLAALVPLALAGWIAADGVLTEDRGTWAVEIALAIAPLVPVAVAATALRRTALHAGVTLGATLALLAAWALAVVALARGAAGAPPAAVATHALSLVAGALLAVAIGRTSRSAGDVLVRRRLGAARAWLARELRGPAPRIEDTWTPWLLALGLGPGVDGWFRAHGAASGSGHGASGGGGTLPAGQGAWTGGGGSFSGGGASGTWAALGAIASGVPAPSSRSSGSGGGGGGGGGGGSGGGGGGGW